MFIHYHMTPEPVAVQPDETVAEAIEILEQHSFRHLPVVEGEDVVGVVSIGDLVKAVIEDQQVELDQLQRYIAS